jgi:dipeptidyl aminopeptidase/acylaminoacyl peptidase
MEVRLVMLDYEDHGYGARESIFHTLLEMIDWFNRHVRDTNRIATSSDNEDAP